ncbi:F-box protein At3g07870-like [Cornus florida]|uniref:F-box protein At3g07870-like n=1 Tax=Cornus florida TaxID=4283 RepID=UPI002899E876|nr:F-box protein At3g07870-like [Cornus florida]
MDLPDSIIMDISFRLPIRTLLQSSVRLATSPFIDIVCPSRNGFSLVELQDHVRNYDTHLRHGPLWFGKLQPAKSSDLKLGLLGSCNGLLCLSDYYFLPCKHTQPNSGRICCPSKTQNRQRERFVAYGFGWSSATGHYKVVIVYKMVEVFSLASGVWRNLGDAPFAQYSLLVGVCLNGAIHWATAKLSRTNNLQLAGIGLIYGQ